MTSSSDPIISNSSSSPIMKEEQQSPTRPSLSQKHHYDQQAFLNPKAEPIDLIPIILALQQETQSEPQLPQIFKAVEQLGPLSSAIDTFSRRFDELQKHLDFIRTAIDTKFKAATTSPSQIHPQIPAAVPSEANPTSQQMGATKDVTAKKPETQSSNGSELRSLCQTMCSRGLRKYVVTHLSDIPRLREEAPAAIKLAPKPAKLVLDCIGRFYLQGIKAYTKDSPMIPARQASVLVLEFFLMMLGNCNEGEIEIEPSVKEEAEKGAIGWRKRLIAEGGLAKAGEIDARGLLAFVACFGIPAAFKNEDLKDLIRLSNPKKILDALRRSRVLVPRIADIIGSVMKKGMHVEAVDVAVIFGMEDKFSPQTILTTFLRESKEMLKRAKREANNSPVALKRANEKHLAALQSMLKCLEDHKINLDLTKVLPGGQIKEQIIKLEKEIADLNKKVDEKAEAKRKMEEIESPEAKRLKFTVKESPLMISPRINGLHDHRAVSHIDGMKPYDNLMPNAVTAGFSGHVHSYYASSLSHGPGVGSLHENILGPKVVGKDSVLAAGVGHNMAAGVDYLKIGSYSRIHGETRVDELQQTISPSNLPHGRHGIRDPTYRQSYAGKQTSVGLASLYGSSSSSVEGFGSLPNLSAGAAATKRSSASDLYGFADAIVENNPYNSTALRHAPLPPTAPAHRSSYLY